MDRKNERQKENKKKKKEVSDDYEDWKAVYGNESYANPDDFAEYEEEE
ncbi:MAG: hypothetical protein AB1650_07345 [Candidatus Omnitrophota bacterium]